MAKESESGNASLDTSAVSSIILCTLAAPRLITMVNVSQWRRFIDDYAENLEAKESQRRG